MTKPNFENVKNYQPCGLKMPLSINRCIWSNLFMFDYLFSLTSKPDHEGDVVKKTECEGLTGRLYNWIYSRLYEEIIDGFQDQKLEEPLEIPSVDASCFSQIEFAQWRKKVNFPLVIKGLIKESRACREWSSDWLVEHYGNVGVKCIDSAFELQSKKSMVGENIKLHNVLLRDFCTRDEYKEFYIRSHHGIFSDDEFTMYCNGDGIDQLHGSKRFIAQWFISRASETATMLHSANSDNLFLNIKGSKEWHFIHPTFTSILLPALSKFAVYAVSEIGEFGLDNYKEVYSKYPHLRRIPKYVCRLEEGDVLYNPPWWWHNVKNKSPFNIGCSTRYVGHPTCLRNSPEFHICQLLDAIKHPSRSALSQGLAIQFLRRDRRKLIDSIFSK